MCGFVSYYFLLYFLELGQCFGAEEDPRPCIQSIQNRGWKAHDVLKGQTKTCPDVFEVPVHEYFVFTGMGIEAWTNVLYNGGLRKNSETKCPGECEKPFLIDPASNDGDERKFDSPTETRRFLSRPWVHVLK